MIESSLCNVPKALLITHIKYMTPKVNVFRPVYRELNEQEKQILEDVKNKAQELYDILENVATPTNGRYIALAKTTLEESVMWGVKGITS
jgi:hypothetical protein